MSSPLQQIAVGGSFLYVLKSQSNNPGVATSLSYMLRPRCL